MNEENRAFEYKIAELKKLESGLKEYCHYGISMLSNMGHYYTTANIENMQRMLGLIIPEKLVYDNRTFYTMQPGEVLNLLCNGGKGFSDGKKEKSNGNAAQSCVVTPQDRFQSIFLEKFKKITELKTDIRVQMLQPAILPRELKVA